MALQSLDPSALVFNFLHDSETTLATEVRDSLVNGASSVLESGDLTPAILSELEALRVSSTSELWNKALCVSVQDAGEVPEGAVGVLRARVVVRVLDRKRGYRNVRATRIALSKIASKGTVGNLYRQDEDGRKYGGAITIKYMGRTGHRSDMNLGVDYEALNFECTYENDSITGG